jgi:hypothetical protein
MIQTRSAPSCLIKHAVVELERAGSGSVHDAAAEVCLQIGHARMRWRSATEHCCAAL